MKILSRHQAGIVLAVAILAAAMPTALLAANADVRTATKYAKGGDFISAMEILAPDFELPTVAPDAIKAMSQSKNFATGLVGQVAATQSLEDINRGARALRIAAHAGLLPADDAHGALNNLRQRYAEGVTAGKLSGNINDDPDLIQDGDAARNAQILRNTITLYSDHECAPEELRSLIAFSSQHQDAAALRKIVESSLPAMRLSIATLRGPVAEAFPAFAQAALAQRVRRVFVTTDGDALFGLDVKDALGGHDDLEIAIDPNQPATRVAVRQLALVIVERPPETETIRYAQTDVRFLAAAFLMPENATYQYEITKGGVEFEYAFEVTTESGGAVAPPQILRDRGSVQWSKCGPGRVVNVFGGSQPATWVANSDMEARCSNGGQQMGVSDVRRKIAEAVAIRVDAIIHAWGSATTLAPPQADRAAGPAAASH